MRSSPRLAHDGRLHAGVTVEQAVALVGTVTGFPACDELASRLDLPLDALPSLLSTALAGVADLG